MSNAITDYRLLLEKFLGGELTAEQFQSTYIDRFKTEQRRLEGPLFELLDGLFGDVDSFTTQPELLAKNPSFYLDEDRLREKVRRVVKHLSALTLAEAQRVDSSISMTKIEFRIDEQVLASDIEHSPAQADPAMLEETYFIMPVRFRIGDVDLFVSASTAEPWIPLPILGFANRLSEALLKLPSEKSVSSYMAGGGSLKIALLERNEVTISCTLAGKTGSDSLDEVIRAARELRNEVQRLLFSRVPDMARHPNWREWFRSEGGPTNMEGRRVTIRPNDFVKTPLAALVRSCDPDSNTLLLEFDSPVEIGGELYLFAVASARLQRDDLASMLRTGVMSSSVTWIPKARYDPAKPFDLSWWRGGAAAITDVVLEQGTKPVR